MGRDPKDKPVRSDVRQSTESKRQAALERRANRGKTDGSDWATADSDLLARAVRAVTSTGCAIQFGYTLDGGAFRVRIVGSETPIDEYVRPSEDINRYLTELSMDFGVGG